jgi:hypothetical protein
MAGFGVEVTVLVFLVFQFYIGFLVGCERENTLFTKNSEGMSILFLKFFLKKIGAQNSLILTNP